MSTHYGLYLLSHSDQRDRPELTERALQVFFPIEAGAYLAALRRGEEILTHHGARAALSALAGRLSAQGFNAAVRAFEPAG